MDGQATSFSRSMAVGPASAGMLPDDRVDAGERGRRPRTRGDAPLRIAKSVADQGSAPHPRGCSATVAVGSGLGAVGPAPAGMLLAPGVPSPSPQSRPRTRGDAPSIQLVEEGRVPSAPHPRGCSLPLDGAVDVDQVGPAPAGMLRGCAIPCGSCPGRPRTRGDAPAHLGVWEPVSVSAPHPRGCSPAGVGHVRVGPVGPAPAGMLRPGPRRRRRPGGRPRTRGDAPYLIPDGVRLAVSAPHPRGCSAPGHPRREREGVGPAPAGMLPTVVVAQDDVLSRPRTRGDAPRSARVLRASGSSAPHPRGCSGEPLPVAHRTLSRPRTRGDAPPSAPGPAPKFWSAPHPRGCSVASASSATGSTVGPAPAGMLRRRWSATR